MANFTSKAEAIVTMNGKEAEVVLNSLKEKAKDLKNQIIAIKKEDPANPNLKKMEKELKSLEKATANVKKTTFEYENILKNLNGASLKDLQKTKQALLTQVKSLKQGTQEWLDKTKQLRQVDAQINKVNASMKQQRNLMTRIADGFTKWFGAITMLTGAFAGLNMIIRKLTGYFKDWEKSFTNVLTLMNDEQIDKYAKSMEEGAINVMKKYGLTIEDTNKALFDAVSAGIPAGESIKFLNEAAQLAISGVTSLSVAVDGMTSILKAYSLETEEANKVAAAFFTAQKYGKTTVAELASGIGKVAPIAQQAGVSYQELLAATAELTLKGIKTEEAFTALRGAFTALIKPGKQAELVLREFNVPVGATEVKAAGLGKTLEALNRIIKENPDAIARAIPNIRGFMAVTALSGDALVHYDTVLKDINEDYGEGSSLAKGFAKQQGTLAQRMARAKAEFVAFVLQNDKLRNILSSLIFTTTKFLKILFSIPHEVYLAAAAFGATIVVIKSFNLLLGLGRTLWLGYNKILLLGMTGFYSLTGNVQKATVAWRAFNIGFSKTAIGAVIVAVTALTIGLGKLFKSTNEVAKAYKEFQKELEKEKINAQALVEAYKNTNQGTEERKKILDKIKEIYGEYIQDLVDEKGELNDIDKALKNINSGLEQKIALTKRNKVADKLTDDYIDEYIASLERLKFYITKLTSEDVADIHIINVKEILSTYKNDIDKAFIEVDNYLTTNKIDQYSKNTIKKYDTMQIILKRMKERMQEYNKEINKLDKKFAIYIQKPSNEPPTDNQQPPPTQETKTEEELEKEREEEEKKREEHFKKLLAQLEQQQRDERNLLAKSYLQGKIDREEYNAGIETIDHTYLLKRKLLHEQFGKDTSTIDADIMNIYVKLMESVYEKMKKTNEEFLKFTKKGKEDLDKLVKDAEGSDKDTAKDLEDEFLQKAEEANKLREELRAGNTGEQMQAEMDALTELHDMMLVSDEEFEQARMQIRIKAFKAYLDQANQLLQAGTQMVGAFQDAEAAKVEATSQRKLQALEQQLNAGIITEEQYAANKEQIENEAAQKKLDVEKKFADVNFAMKVAEITANAAMGIATAWARAPSEGLIHGPILAAIMTGIIVATSVAQIAAANAERQKVKAMTLDSASGSSSPPQQRVVLPGIEEGGYTEVEREQDGKHFSAKKRKKRGYADEPSVLIGEDGAEFVANADAVKNPTVKPVLDLINIAQQNGSISSINLPKLINSMYAVKGYESGGYTSTPTETPLPAAAINNQEVVAVMKDVRDLLTSLKTNGVDAWVVLSQLQKQQALLEKSEKLGSRK
jgi:TP901 family phage tail tape measure protein